MRRLLVTLAVVAVLLATLGLFVGWAVGTESGLRFVWRQVEPRLSADVAVERLEGRLAGPLAISRLSLTTDTLRVELEAAELDWRPLALLRRTFDVQRLAMRGLNVLQIDEAPPEDEPWGLDTPIDVRIGEARVDGLTFRASPEAEPLVIDRVLASGALTQQALSLERLEVDAPDFALRGWTVLATEEAGDAEGRIEWVARPEGYPPATGFARVAGTTRELVFEQTTEPPYATKLEVRIEHPLTEPLFRGNLSADLRPAEIDPELPPGSLDLQLSFRGTPEEVELAGELAARAEAIEDLRAEWQARYVEGTLHLDMLELLHPPSGALVRADGALELMPELALDLQGSWSRLQLPWNGDPGLASDSGSFRAYGTLANYTLELDAAVTVQADVHGRLLARADGDAESLRLQHIALESDAGRLTGFGAAVWSPRLALSVELAVEDLDPSAFDPDWPGLLSGALSARAGYDEQDDLVVRLEQLDLEGRLRERQVALDALGEHAAGRTRLERLTVRAGDSRLEARGTSGERVDIEWRLESPNLADLWPGLGGELAARGRVAGPLERPRLTVDASGEGLRLEQTRVGLLELDADIDLSGSEPSRVELVMANALAQDVAVDELRLSGQGDAQHHDVLLTAATDLGRATLAMTGAVDRPLDVDPLWRFDVVDATVEPEAFPPWRLRAPGVGQLGIGQARLEETCWDSGTATLCIEASHDADRSEAALALSQLPFDYLGALLTQRVNLEGAFDLDARVELAPDAAPDVRVDLITTRGRLLPPDEAFAFEFGPAQARLRAAEDIFDAEVDLPLQDDGRFVLRAHVPPDDARPLEQRPLDASLEAEVFELAFLEHLVAGLTGVGGRITGDIRFSGTLAQPVADGRFALTEGSATLRDLNVTVTEVELAVIGAGTGELALEGTARSADGIAQAQGHLLLADPGPLGRVTLTGEVFEVLNTSDGQVFASPDLTLTLEPERIELTGSVLVPRATLTPRELDEFAVTTSPDEIIVDAEPEEAEAPLLPPIIATIELRLGEDVQFEGYGLEGRLAGAVQVREEPGEPVRAVGELRVEDGTYEAYGQALEIRTGRLLFAAGPVTQPGLDIEAVRRPAENVLVGARVRGTVERPQLMLFSEPEMAQQEQLSYLILGRPLAQASDAEALSVSNVALALGLRGGEFVSERIREGLGFEEFGVRTEPGEPLSEAAFVIGTYLTPSLYVSYGVGLFEPDTRLQLQYLISRRLRLVTESGSEGSATDIIYHVERDGRR